MVLTTSWQFWAAGAAIFAALTAIFAKVGVAGVNSDFATLIRILVILPVLTLFLLVSGNMQNPSGVSGRAYLFLALSGLATGASWLCYFRALQIGNAGQVAPIDKLSVVLVAVFAFLFLGEQLSALAWLGIVMIGAGAALVALG